MDDEEARKGDSRQNDKPPTQDDNHDEEELSDLHQEIRILQQGAQVLTAFLTILPFNEGFQRLDETEKWVYLATFLSSLIALIFFSAPAAQHRLARPLRDREKFKNFATRMVIIGLFPMSFALILSTQLVVSQVFGPLPAYITAGIVAALIAVVWFILPIARKKEM
jgi:hypothetical protein